MPSRTLLPRSRVLRGVVKSRNPAAPLRALLVIDHEGLQRVAWAEFLGARRRLDQAARHLHRHEEIDVPAFQAWLHRHYPLEVTALRELRDEVTAKTARIRLVQSIAARTGRSMKFVWREQKEAAADPAKFHRKAEAEREAEEQEEAENSERRKEARIEDFETGAKPHRTVGARDIYRRLVQRLHPDRGGDWSSARERLWHEVQQAWAAGDGDWLARLEVEWETAHETVGPSSPLSRLRAALEEIHAAWRDSDAKLGGYRGSLPWRFTRPGANEVQLARRVEADFVRETRALRRQLSHLDAAIAAWDADWTRADSRSTARRVRRPRRTGRAW